MLTYLLYSLYRLRVTPIDFGEPLAELEGRPLFARQNETW